MFRFFLITWVVCAGVCGDLYGQPVSEEVVATDAGVTVPEDVAVGTVVPVVPVVGVEPKAEKVEAVSALAVDATQTTITQDVTTCVKNHDWLALAILIFLWSGPALFPFLKDVILGLKKKKVEP